MTIHRINNWSEFKILVKTLAPETVYYLPEPHPLRKPPLGLRLTFYHHKDMYVFVDYADTETLHRTEIPITNPQDNKKAELKEEDIKKYLITELGKVNLTSLPPFIY